MNTYKLKKVKVSDLYEISKRSANTKDKRLFIYENDDLSLIIGKQRAEELRRLFLVNKIQIKQITNNPTLQKFSNNDEFINSCMTFRYIPKSIYTIEHEILVFDDTTAVYNMKPYPKMLIIEDKFYAGNQKQLFLNLWEEGLSPKMGFNYRPNHSFYNEVDFQVFGKQIILFPDIDAKKAYPGFTYKDLKTYLEKILQKNRKFMDDADFLVAFIWSYNANKMIDLWKFYGNCVDERSGPLSDSIVFRNGEACTNLGMASGNTLIVLGYEEKLRRQSENLKSFLAGPPPNLPLEIMSGKDFFNSD